MYNDQNRPPWLRNLRPPRPEPAPAPETSAPTVAEPVVKPARAEVSVAAGERARGAITRRQVLLLLLLLWGNISVLGCFLLLAIGVISRSS